MKNKWVKVFKNEPSKICGRQPLKSYLKLTIYHFNLFRGCLPQILLGPFLNTLTQLWGYEVFKVYVYYKYNDIYSNVILDKGTNGYFKIIFLKS